MFKFRGPLLQDPGVLGLFWMRSEWQRAGLLRELGRGAEAREIEDELRKLLAYADSDHAILRSLRLLSQREEAGLPRTVQEGPSHLF